jgi:hypothetical protein
MSVPKVIGQCIYCGTRERPLQREHVIPLSLDGTIILHKASCDKCADITKKIENRVTRDMLGPFRSAMDIRTRRPKERPKVHPVLVEPVGGRPYTIKVPTAEFPTTISLPVLPYARYLLGLPDMEGEVPVRWWTLTDKDRLRALHKKAGHYQATFSVGGYDSSAFAQMLCKIAHGLAVDHFGIDGFKPLAVEHALGHKTTINYLVGCRRNEEIPPPQDWRHAHRFIRWRRKPELIVAEIRLFADLGAPIYHVVVGIRKDGLKRRFVKFALRVRKLIPRAPISRIKRLHGLIKSARKRRKRRSR